MKPWYRFEPTPIVIKEQPRGGTSTQLSDLSGRVIDAYTDMPIGAVIYQADGRFHAHPFFPETPAREGESNEIEGDWGPRADRAARAIWDHYWRQFGWTERIARYLWRSQKVGWLVVGTIFGAVTQLVLRNV